MTSGEGTVFGKYFLLKKIASGGMGEIFLAKLMGPEGFEKLLVIKRILQHHLENKDFVDMFFAEARVAAQLSHSNIVQIYEMGAIEDCYYIAMEYVHGKPLSKIIDRARARDERICPAHAAEIISKLCEGLSYAHSARNLSGDSLGIIHRDINPHNLLVSYSGEVKVIDFGIAKSEMQQHKTETGTIKGKFAYMSPEQSAAEPLDRRSDLFSAGICLYEAVSGVNPFARANMVLSLDAIQRVDPSPPSSIDPTLAPFDPIVARALAKSRDNRYADCSEMRDALQLLRVRGDIPPPKQSLQDYMHLLFEETIETEKKIILENDSASSTQIRLMQLGMQREHSSGPHRAAAAQQAAASGMGGAAPVASPAVEAQPAPQMPFAGKARRAPFLIALLAMTAVSLAAAAAVLKAVEQRRRSAVARPPVEVTLVKSPTQPAAPTVASTPTTQVEPAVASKPPAAPVEQPASPPKTEDGSSTAVASAEPKTGKSHNKSTSRPGDNPSASAHTQVASAPAASPPPSAPPPPPPPPPPPVVTASAKESGNEEADQGTLYISASPPVRIQRNGNPAGNTLKLWGATGKLVLGTGKDASTDPFVVRIRYAVEGGSIAYTIDSDPWSIVTIDGIGAGKTPILPVKRGGTTLFEFVNPIEKRRFRLTLRFAR